MNRTTSRDLEPLPAVPVKGVDEVAAGVARHRRHRFPARTESVRAR